MVFHVTHVEQLRTKYSGWEVACPLVLTGRERADMPRGCELGLSAKAGLVGWGTAQSGDSFAGALGVASAGIFLKIHPVLLHCLGRFAGGF